MANVDSERKEKRKGVGMVWEDDELQREQVRGVFALGVIASIIAYLTYANGIKIPPTNVAATNLLLFLELASLILIAMWGIYIVFIAMSMTFWSAREPFRTILRGFKFWGRFSFYLGSFMTLVFGSYYVPLFFIEQIQTENLLIQIVFVIVFALAFTIFGLYPLVRYLGGRRQKARLESQVNSVPTPPSYRPGILPRSSM